MKIIVCFYITSVINYFAALMLRTPTYVYVCRCIENAKQLAPVEANTLLGIYQEIANVQLVQITDLSH